MVFHVKVNGAITSIGLASSETIYHEAATQQAQ